MIDNRRQLLQLILAAAPALLVSRADAFADAASKPATGGASPHDFDFFLGKWRVKHRRLKTRLANSNDWEEYEGTTHWQAILGGAANLNDSTVNRSTGVYRGMGLRAFDAKSNAWTDWYLDGRDPTKVELHGVGRFQNRIGTFFADDTWEGKPIKVRGIFSPIGTDAAQWEQAFSADGGKTWETNYVMRHTRATQ